MRKLIIFVQLIGHVHFYYHCLFYHKILSCQGIFEKEKRKNPRHFQKIWGEFGADITKTLVYQGFLTLFYASCRDRTGDLILTMDALCLLS